jgi:hypothetical protein
MKSIVLLAGLAMISAPIAAWAGPASDAVAFFYASPSAEFEQANRDRFADPARSVLDSNDRAELCIDFVPSIDAQDFEQSEIDRTLKLDEVVSGSDATVNAYFNLFPGQSDSERLIIWTLKQVGGEWKVADIMSDTSQWLLSEFECQ